MKIIQKDIIQAFKDREIDWLLHGCNCQSTMKSGIAGQLVKEFPELEKVDKDFIYASEDRLGKFSFLGFDNQEDNIHTQYIVNLYTQVWYGRKPNVVYVSYSAITKCFRRFANQAKLVEKKSGTPIKIGYPMIGAGLGNGDWSIISEIINTELEGLDHTLYIL